MSELASIYVSPLHTPGTGQALWRDKLSQLLESTGEGIFGIDMDGRCTFINRAGDEQLGYAPEPVRSKNKHQLAHHTHAEGPCKGAHYPEHLCPIFNAFRMAAPCRIDTEFFWRKNGSAFVVEYSSYPIVEDAQVQGAVVTFVDISARRQSEAANAYRVTGMREHARPLGGNIMNSSQIGLRSFVEMRYQL